MTELLEMPPAAPGRKIAGLGVARSRSSRTRKDRIFVAICLIAATASVIVLLILLSSIVYTGWSRLTWQFLTAAPSRFADQAGILPATVGTFAICAVCAVTAVPIGVASAILLEEYKPSGRWLGRFHQLVQINITNLAGVPSIVYGILGLTVFVQLFNLAGSTSTPLFEIGASYVDRFVLLDGRPVMVDVAAADTAVTTPVPTLPFRDEAGNPVVVRVLSDAEVGKAIRDAEDKLETFEIKLEDRIDELRAMGTTPALAAAVADEWAKSGLDQKPDVIAGDFAGKLATAIQAPGREGKRALRVQVKALASKLAAASFPDALLDSAKPSRVREPAPWYVRIPFGRSVLAGGLTLMLVVLPIIIISTQEAFRSVSSSMRQASLALGASKWQTIWNVTLPASLPGIMTGVILAMSRAVGEAAPVLIIAGIVYITFTPRHLMDDFTAMPLQIYQWASLPQSNFHEVAAAGIILLLVVLFCFNGLAIYIRHRTQRQV
jgi:phosphate transport system permease protein